MIDSTPIEIAKSGKRDDGPAFVLKRTIAETGFFSMRGR